MLYALTSIFATAWTEASLNLRVVVTHSFKNQQLTLSLSTGTIKKTQMADTFLVRVELVTLQSHLCDLKQSQGNDFKWSCTEEFTCAG